MLLNEIIKRLDLKVYCGAGNLVRTVTGGYTSDLLSDVMGFAKEGQVWITLQTHKNVVAIASLKELSAILLVKGYEPDADALEQARAEGIPILGTMKQSFEISGELYKILTIGK